MSNLGARVYLNFEHPPGIHILHSACYNMILLRLVIGKSKHSEKPIQYGCIFHIACEQPLQSPRGRIAELSYGSWRGSKYVSLKGSDRVKHCGTGNQDTLASCIAPPDCGFLHSISL